MRSSNKSSTESTNYLGSGLAKRPPVSKEWQKYTIVFKPSSNISNKLTLYSVREKEPIREIYQIVSEQL